jgi:hypothetical protein
LNSNHADYRIANVTSWANSQEMKTAFPDHRLRAQLQSFGQGNRGHDRRSLGICAIAAAGHRARHQKAAGKTPHPCDAGHNAVAQFERDLTKERQREGIALAKTEGGVSWPRKGAA